MQQLLAVLAGKAAKAGGAKLMIVATCLPSDQGQDDQSDTLTVGQPIGRNIHPSRATLQAQWVRVVARRWGGGR